MIVVITVEDGGVVYGSNAWHANDRDRRTYNNEGKFDEQA